MAILYFLIIISALLFFQGFFPVASPNVGINNSPPTEIRHIFLNKQNLYATNITKTVFIVIDALRLDFANSNYMPLTLQLVHKNGCFNKIKVEIPTVTLPRIKALTAGNIPQFIDLILNLASTEVLTDSFIHSAVRDNKKVIFYGDDTWLKLFPQKFLRFEGTNSFFVRDFTEVDNNVTRNVNIELKNEDWDIMILHYLGLDHIGHVYGPFSSLIPTKLKEMDEIINKISTNISAKNENTLFIITGDHGMRDSGGHGGSTYSETTVPLLIVGLNCENNSFPQTDIPVNLAVLLGLNIPSLSIGRVHKSLIQSKTIEKYLYILYYNAILLNQKHSCKNILVQANEYYLDYLTNSNESSAYKAIELYEEILKVASKALTKSSVKQNVFFLIIASMTMLNCLTTLFSELVSSRENNSAIFKYLMVAFVIIQDLVEENLVIFFVLFILLGLFLLNSIYTLTTVSIKLSNIPKPLTFFMFSSLIHPITFLSSSYVEEEHQFWYFLNIIILFFQFVQFLKIKNVLNLSFCIMLLASFRFLRTLNSTGDKWSNYPDLSDWFLQNENNMCYQILFISGLILVFLSQCYLTEFKKILNLLNFLILVLIYVFKQKEYILLGKLIWLFILINFILTYKISKILTWTLILSLLLKPYNVILIPYCIFSSVYFSNFYKNTELMVLYHTFLSNMLFFAQGHSNSLASVDISVGYIGLTSYQPILVIGQVLCHTQAFPVLCHLLIFSNTDIDSKKTWKILFCSRLYIFLITSLVNFIFRHHLFIWSVFAPKLFIEFIHISFLFIEYLIYNINTLFLTENNLYRLWKIRGSMFVIKNKS